MVVPLELYAQSWATLVGDVLSHVASGVGCCQEKRSKGHGAPP